ncbi:MAG: hypothetical protein OSJ60_16485 [Lachnospiraceae bacterium]|nr:hypothetical protein [Lachnospiraceae bacterium]
MKTMTSRLKTIFLQCMKTNLIRLFIKEDNACYQDIYKQFMQSHCGR